MKLQFKLTLILVLVGFITLGVTSLTYVNISHSDAIKTTKDELSKAVQNAQKSVNHELLDKLKLTKTIATAPILEETLLESNKDFGAMNSNQREEKINTLNQKWINERKTKTKFIDSYLNNKLALYLKKQQIALPAVYGEIFITNKYGSIVATTGVLSTLAHSHKYWWKESFNKGKGKIFFDDRGYDKSVGGYVIGVTIPIKKDGQIIGILKSNVNIIASLDKVVKNYKRYDNGELKIVRTKGLIVSQSDSIPLSSKISSELIEELRLNKTGIKFIDNDEILTSFSPIDIKLKGEDIGFGGKPGKIDHIKGNVGEMWHAVIYRDIDNALKQSKNINQLILIAGILLTFILVIISYFIVKLVTKPIIKLKDTTNRIKNGETDLRSDITTNDEIGTLANSFNEMLNRLKQTTASRDQLAQEIKKRQDAEDIMISQSRFAAMGEMINTIAHQWRQPISTISMDANIMIADIEFDTVDKDTFLRLAEHINERTQELSMIIENFKDMFKEDKSTKYIYIEDLFTNVFTIIGKSLENHNIKVQMNIKDNILLNTYPNELLRVLMNIIKNAKEVLVKRKIENKLIKIDVNIDANDLVILVSDNAGGIDDKIISNIFEPYFSTKEGKNSLGLGLFTGKMIVERHLKGSMRAFNNELGGCLEIKHPIDSKEENNG